jgi:integrase
MFLSKRKGIYHVFYEQPNGKLTSKTTKTKLKSEALKFLTEFQVKLNEKKQSKIEPISLKDFSFQFLKFSESIHAWSTTKGYKTTFKYLLAYLGNVQLTEINQKTMMEYFQKRINDSSVYRARIDRINLGFAFNRAVLDGYLLESPVKNIKRFRIPEKLPLFFSENDFEKLLQVVQDQDLKDLIIFAIKSGLRQGELINLEYNQIDFTDKLLILDNRNYLTKSRKIRTVLLNNTAFAIVEKRKSQEPESIKIFTYKGEPIDQYFLSQKFKTYVLKAKINPKLCFHSLRHSFASWLIQKGVSIYEVSKLLGHSDIKTTVIYAHLRNEDLRRSVAVLD